MKQSTVSIFKKHGYRIDKSVHNYLYYKFYYPYIKIMTVFVKIMGNHTWFKPLSIMANLILNRYHSKVLSREDTRKIFELNEDLSLISEETKQIVPYKYATDIIFKNPEKIVVMDCPCKKSTNAPEENINSCFMIGDAGDFWLESCKKYNPRKVTSDEALNIIDRLRSRGHVTKAFFKVATGGASGCICNCHPDYCLSLIASKITPKLGKNVTHPMAQAGYSIEFHQDKCNKCGACVKTCTFDAIVTEGGNLYYYPEKCYGCGLCVQKCTRGAISLYVDPDKPVPFDLDIVRGIKSKTEQIEKVEIKN